MFGLNKWETAALAALFVWLLWRKPQTSTSVNLQLTEPGFLGLPVKNEVPTITEQTGPLGGDFILNVLEQQ